MFFYLNQGPEAQFVLLDENLPFKALGVFAGCATAFGQLCVRYINCDALIQRILYYHLPTR